MASTSGTQSLSDGSGGFAVTGPGYPVVESVRVDQVTPRAKTSTRLRLIAAIVIAFIMLIPVLWMAMTAIKPRPLTTAVPPQGHLHALVRWLRRPVHEPHAAEPGRAGCAAEAHRPVVLGQAGAQPRHEDSGPEQVRRPARELPDHIAHIDVPGGGVRLTIGLRVQSLRHPRERRLALLHPEYAHVACRRGHHPDLPDVPRCWVCTTRISA